MIFHETKLEGAFIIEIDPKPDERGYFCESWNAKEFAEKGIKPFVRTAISHNPHKLTLRGMHFQKAPHAEGKMIRVNRGALYDVMVDLRAESPTFKQWIGLELRAGARQMLYAPEGFAHGFITLEDDTEMTYYLTSHYNADAGSGVRWNDPAFNIQWPEMPKLISPRDANYPDFS